MQGTPVGVASLGVPEWCDGLVEWLQVWGSGVGYSGEQDQDPVDALGHYKGQVALWILDYLTSDTVFKQALTDMAIFDFTALLTENRFYALSSSRIHSTLSMLPRRELQRLTLEPFALGRWSTGLNDSCNLALIFLDEFSFFSPN